MQKHKCFISYHHAGDQVYRDALQKFNEEHDIYVDKSVSIGDIDDYRTDESIREAIRDNYLRDSTVTILLVGTETKQRKHVDWELYSSMINGSVNKKSGVIVVMLPTTGCAAFTAAHGDVEKVSLYPSQKSWITVNSRAEYERRYPFAPARIIDNLLARTAKMSVVQWEKLTAENLRLLIDLTHQSRFSATYDLSRPMMRQNL